MTRIHFVIMQQSANQDFVPVQISSKSDPLASKFCGICDLGPTTQTALAWSKWILIVFNFFSWKKTLNLRASWADRSSEGASRLSHPMERKPSNLITPSPLWT